MTNWRTNLGGAISVLGESLVGVGVLGQLGSVDESHHILWYVALVGFVLNCIGKGTTALFAADAATIKELQARTVEAVGTGDTTRLAKPLTDKPAATEPK